MRSALEFLRGAFLLGDRWDLPGPDRAAVTDALGVLAPLGMLLAPVVVAEARALTAALTAVNATASLGLIAR